MDKPKDSESVIHNLRQLLAMTPPKTLAHRTLVDVLEYLDGELKAKKEN